ncbi:MAG: AbrB/MazE/SpoVT family DNA-binding domain-containing protein [Desulfobacteraceae bacterium]|nr:AbrB/MazE/SpoVT family DNA-binding domain-containing protein [Desulfobacteraceae bacterium]MBC2757967.1 AbrB/MazE/SpoVT family DNA-binding domain-containing protein [Desulfobacteraceae bacterium]
MYAKISKKGQVTIPKAIRKKLNIDKEGGLLFLVKDNEVRLQGVPASPVDQLAGSLKKYVKGHTPLEKVRSDIQEKIAKEIVEKP